MPAPALLPLPERRGRQEVDRSRSFRIVDDQRSVVRVTDLDFAAYILERGIAIINAVQTGPYERVFDFWDPKREIPKYSIEFANSITARVLDCVRRLKKVTYSVPQDWDPWNNKGS